MGKRGRPRLTIVCENYWPEVASTGQLITELAEGLAPHFEVEVLTAQPRYHGRYERQPRRQRRGGVDIRRLPSTRFSKSRGAGRIANWLTFFLAAAVAVLVRWRRRTYLLVTNPPTAPWVALVTRLQRQRTFVLVYDLYPDLAEALGAVRSGGGASRAFDLVNRAAFGGADGLVVVGDDMARRIRAKLGERAHLTVIPNWADGSQLVPHEPCESEFLREHGLTGRFVFLYAGNLGRFQDLETLVEAVERLEACGGREPALVFVGGGEKRARLEELARTCSRVRVYDYVPYERLGDLYAAASVGLIALEPGVEHTNVPSKTYSIMAAGLPFLAVCSGSTDLEALAAVGCGVCVRNDAGEVAEAMARYLEDEACRRAAGARARQVFDERFSKGGAIERYRSLLSST